jgi:hypothetical protein
MAGRDLFLYQNLPCGNRFRNGRRALGIGVEHAVDLSAQGRVAVAFALEKRGAGIAGEAGGGFKQLLDSGPALWRHRPNRIYISW